jgi:3-oxoacyl-(acyl-carrier-protein) synthase
VLVCRERHDVAVLRSVDGVRERSDPECDLNYTPNQAAQREVEVAISNSFGFGGHNVTLAVRKYRE